MPEICLVLIWARSIATSGDVGGSLRAWCRAHGMSRSTFDRRRVRACAQIAAEMNRAGEGALEALESLRVEAPVLAACIERF